MPSYSRALKRCKRFRRYEKIEGAGWQGMKIMARRIWSVLRSSAYHPLSCLIHEEQMGVPQPWAAILKLHRTRFRVVANATWSSSARSIMAGFKRGLRIDAAGVQHRNQLHASHRNSYRSRGVRISLDIEKTRGSRMLS